MLFRYSALRRSASLGSAAFAAVAGGVSASSCTAAGGNGSSKLTDLSGKVVLITGAGAGIGEACAHRFADQKAKLVLVGRRTSRLEAVRDDIHKNHPECKVLLVTLDVSDTDAIMALPAHLADTEFAAVSVLVNNAGLALGVSSADTNSVSDIVTVLKTNVMGTMTMCRAFLPGMLERGEGHIVNMGSVAGHFAYATGSIYCASKYAVHGFTSAMRHDLMASPIRVTHISPGMVGGTEFSVVRLGDESKAAAVYAGIEALRADDVADNVIYATTRPAHAQIAEITMYATNQSGPRDVARVGPSLGKKQ